MHEPWEFVFTGFMFGLLFSPWWDIQAAKAIRMGLKWGEFIDDMAIHGRTRLK